MDSTSIQFRSHTALLLAASIPYLQPDFRRPAELAMKFLEFSETMKLYRELSQRPLHTNIPSPTEESGVFAVISRFIQDPEGLLKNLSCVCTGKEKELITLLLNLIQAKSFYENYGDILNTFMPANKPSSEDFSGPDMNSFLSGGDLSSMLNKEQNDTLNLLKNLLAAE